MKVPYSDSVLRLVALEGGKRRIVLEMGDSGLWK